MAVHFRPSELFMVPLIHETPEAKEERLMQEFLAKINEHNELEDGDLASEERIEEELKKIYDDCPSALYAAFVMDGESEEGITPFYRAYFANNERLVRFLFGIDESVIQTTSNGLTAFLDACMGASTQEGVENKIAMIQTLYELNPLVLDQVDEDGHDGIFLALLSRDLQVLQALLELNRAKAQASLNKKNDGFTLFQTIAIQCAKETEGEKKQKLVEVIRVLLAFDLTLKDQLSQPGDSDGAKRARTE